MRGRVNLLIGMAAIAVTAPSHARIVDYSLDDSTILKEAAELKITPVSDTPKPGDRRISVSFGKDIDHITTALGMYCSAYKVENPITQLIKRVAAERSISELTKPTEAAPPLAIQVTAARSYRLCVELGEMNVRCIVRVVIDGTASTPDGNQVPIKADVERDSSVSGICGSLARGIRVVSREAGVQLVKDAETKIAATSGR